MPERPTTPPSNTAKHREAGRASRRVVLGATAWSVPVISLATAAPAMAVSGTGTTSVLGSGGDRGARTGFVLLGLSPDADAAAVSGATVLYDDSGATTTSLLRTGGDAQQGLYRLSFSTTTTPPPDTITVTITIPGYGTTPAAVRFDPGSLDAGFADPALNNTGRGVAVQPDGKVLVTGDFTTAGGQTRGRLARFNADGTLDTTFADPALNGIGYGVAVQPDGKVLVTGNFTTAGGQARGGLARFNADGTLDTTFADPALNSTRCRGGGAARREGPGHRRLHHRRRTDPWRVGAVQRRRHPGHHLRRPRPQRHRFRGGGAERREGPGHRRLHHRRRTDP